ncbi:hypothetical protein OVY29_24080 [Sphingopyxis sp. SE2]|jgi:hypothetical protein|uniref:Uncharacterized protein n=1 Tax=Blastomonas natatoria TaxID=34015 RepID=A0A2V3UQ53_9SPHN|nr:MULTISPECIES: hypothetical protein [Sphingomonadaceae]MDT7531734.1 hypothetical protein [Sphingopyxis sp. SE2]PXW68306.1 hypothetical protein C7451_11829 [Blastomonas natatoria]
MYDLDHSLRALAAQPIPAHLAMIDEAVFAGLEAHRREVGAGSRLMGLAGAFALVLGVISGTLADASPAIAQPLSPFSPDNPLAPSTLLDVHS